MLAGDGLPAKQERAKYLADMPGRDAGRGFCR